MRAYLLVAAMLASSCSGSSGTTLFVDLRTDYEAGTDFALVAVEVVQGSAGHTRRREVFARDDYTRGDRVADVDGLVPGRTNVEVTLSDADGAYVGQARAIVELPEGVSAVTLVIQRSCVDVRCDTTETCIDTVCRDATCTADLQCAMPADAGPAMDAAPPDDAGPGDPGPSDAGPGDAGPPDGSTGRCNNPGDQSALMDTWGGETIDQILTRCGRDCLVGGAIGPLLETCTTECMNLATSGDVSRPCIGCYSRQFGCVARLCTAPCIDATSAACLSCKCGANMDAHDCVAERDLCRGIRSRTCPP